MKVLYCCWTYFSVCVSFKLSLNWVFEWLLLGQTQWTLIDLFTWDMREPLTTADVTTANVTTVDSTANVSMANVTTADVLGLGARVWVKVWVRVWVRAGVVNTTASLGQYSAPILKRAAKLLLMTNSHYFTSFSSNFFDDLFFENLMFSPLYLTKAYPPEIFSTS